MLVVVAVVETEASVVDASADCGDHREILEPRVSSKLRRAIDQPPPETRVLGATLSAPTQPERVSVDVDFSNQGTDSQLGIGQR